MSKMPYNCPKNKIAAIFCAKMSKNEIKRVDRSVVVC